MAAAGIVLETRAYNLFIFPNAILERNPLVTDDRVPPTRRLIGAGRFGRGRQTDDEGLKIR